MMALAGVAPRTVSSCGAAEIYRALRAARSTCYGATPTSTVTARIARGPLLRNGAYDACDYKAKGSSQKVPPGRRLDAAARASRTL